MKTKITISLLFTASFLFNSNISKAQWTSSGGFLYPNTLSDKVGVGTTTPAWPLEIGAFINPSSLFAYGNAFNVGLVHNVAYGRAAIGHVHGTNHVVFGTLDTLSDILFANYDGTNFNHRVRVASTGNVGIGKNTTPDVSALLDVNASNKGVLLPQIALVSTTDATTIASPATSLLVYNLGTGGLSPAGYYYNAGNSTIPNWVMFGVSNGWSLTGNAGTTPGTINFIGTTDNKDFVIKTNNTEKVRVLANGNVGIATSTPQSYAKLDVNTSGNMSVHTMDNANGGLLLGYQGPSIQGRTTSDGNGNLYLNNFGGNVGIGTTTPTQKLVVYGPTASCPAKVGSPDGYLLFGPANTSWCHFYTDRQGFYFDKGISVDGGGISSYYTQDLKLQTSGGVTKVTILDAGGNVGIGTTSPGEKLEVNGNLKVNGNSTRTGTDNYTSDLIFKTNIDTIDNAIGIIHQLNPKTFYFDTTNAYGLNFPIQKQYGLIAQNVDSVLPELVTSTIKSADLDSAGNIIHPAITYKSLNYNAFIAILMRGIQEQQKIITDLTSKDLEHDSITTELQNQLNILSNTIDACCKNENKKSHGKINNYSEGKANQTNVKLIDAQTIVLEQNVPNPFAEQTTISYFLPDNTGKAQILFYNWQGKLIQSVELNEKGEGQLNVFASDLTNGIYTYTLVLDGRIVETKKMMKQ